MKNWLIGLLSFVWLAPAAAQPRPDRREWVQLFNGKNLDGWDAKIAGFALNDNVGRTFRVENGLLRIAYDQYDRFNNRYGHLYYRKPFSHYILRFEYRFVGDQVPGGAAWNLRNSGVMIHSQSAQSVGRNQHFPVSLEIQLLGGLGKGERHTANLCTPGTIVDMNGRVNPAHCIDSESKTYDGDGWVTVEAVVLGDSLIRHVIDGQTVLAYEKPRIGGGFVSPEYGWAQAFVANPEQWIRKEGTLLGEGYIALQSESHPIDFRRVELLPLKGCMDPKATNYKSYYVVADNSQCRYK